MLATPQEVYKNATIDQTGEFIFIKAYCVRLRSD